MVPKVGKKYYIRYIDPNYPCNCECHTNRYICHIMACCSDYSWSGVLRCMSPLHEVDIPKNYYLFTDDVRTGFYQFHEYSIIEEVSETTTLGRFSSDWECF